MYRRIINWFNVASNFAMAIHEGYKTALDLRHGLCLHCNELCVMSLAYKSITKTF